MSRLRWPWCVILLATSAAWAGQLNAAEGDASPKGENPYTAWQNGPGHDAGYFPIAVWLQDPKNAAKYKAIGVNL